MKMATTQIPSQASQKLNPCPENFLQNTKNLRNLRNLRDFKPNSNLLQPHPV